MSRAHWILYTGFCSSFLILSPHLSALVWTACYVLANYAWIYAYRTTPVSFRLGSICLGILILSALTSLPPFENDFYRYYWDGHQVASGRNPYEHPPKLAPVPSSVSPEIKGQIGYPELVTLYPPLTQLLFGLCAFLSSGLTSFRWLLIGSGFLFLILGMRKTQLNTSDSNANSLLSILLHPIAITEWWHHSHYDIWLAGVVVWTLTGQSRWLGWIVGIHLKLSTLPLLILERWSLRKLLASTFLLSVVALPFFGHLHEGSKTLSIFAQYWEMNSGMSRWITQLFLAFKGTHDLAPLLARISCLSLWAGVVLLIFQLTQNLVERCFWILSTLIWMSPVVNVWYFTWALPLIPLLPRAQQKLSLHCFALLPLSYIYFEGHRELTAMAWNIEHLAILCGVFVFAWKRLFKIAPTPNSQEQLL